MKKPTFQEQFDQLPDLEFLKRLDLLLKAGVHGVSEKNVQRLLSLAYSDEVFDITESTVLTHTNNHLDRLKELVQTAIHLLLP